jgi:hypothetical protein
MVGKNESKKKKSPKRYLVYKGRKYRIKSKDKDVSDKQLYKDLVKIIKKLIPQKRKRSEGIANASLVSKDFIPPKMSAGPITEEQLKRYEQLADIQRQQELERKQNQLEDKKEELKEQQSKTSEEKKEDMTQAVEVAVAKAIEENGGDQELTKNPTQTGINNYAFYLHRDKLRDIVKDLNIKPLPKLKKQLFKALMDNSEVFRDHVETFATNNPYPTEEEVRENFNTFINANSGSGLVDGKPGLFNYEVGDLMEGYRPKGFLGVFSVDELEQIKSRSNPYHVCFILNIVPHTVPMGHFVSIWIDFERNTLEYYDPLGGEPTKRFMREIPGILKRLGVKTAMQFKINRVQFQSFTSANCGYFAMRFLKRRFKGESWKSATGYNQFKGIAKSEKGIREFANKMKEFGYLIPKAKGAEGKGIVDSFISALPVELHLWGTNEVTGKSQKSSFIGPGTKLGKRLNPDNSPKPDSIPINDLDRAAYKHDLAYRDYKDTAHRNAADDVLYRSAETFEKKPGISALDKVDAKIVETAMKLIHRKV